MSCTYRHLTHTLATTIGIPDSILMTAIDTSREPLPPSLSLYQPLMEHLRTRIPWHETDRALQVAIQGLIALLPHIPESHRVRAAAVVAALITPPSPPSLPPISERLVATLRDEILQLPPPAPLPSTMSLRAPDALSLLLAARLHGDQIPPSLIPTTPTPATAAILIRAGIDHESLWHCVATDPREAARLLCAGWTHPALLASVTQSAQIAAEVLGVRQDLPADDLLSAIIASRELLPLLHVLRERPDLHMHPAIRAVLTQEPWVAWEAIRADPSLRHDSEIVQSITDPDVAARLLIDYPDLRMHDHLIAAAAARADTAAKVLTVWNTDADTSVLRTALAESPELAMTVMVSVPSLASDRQLVHAIARKPFYAAVFVEIYPDWYQDATVRSAIHSDPYAARQVLWSIPQLRTDHDLIATVCRRPRLIRSLITKAPELSVHPIILAQLAKDPPSLKMVLSVTGPYPELWQSLPPPQRDQIAARFKMTPDVRAWLDDLADRAQRGERYWNASDESYADSTAWGKRMRRWMVCVGEASEQTWQGMKQQWKRRERARSSTTDGTS